MNEVTPTNYGFSSIKAQILFGKLVEHLGFLSPRKVQKCFHLNSNTPSQISSILGEVFIQKNYLPPQQVLDLSDFLNKALRKFHELLYSSIAVERKIIDESYLQEELHNLGNNNPSIEEVLKNIGILTESLHQEIQNQKQKRIQDMPAESLTKAILKIVDQMKRAGTTGRVIRDDFFGERAVGLGWITLENLRLALSKQVIMAVSGYYVPIGRLLLEMKVINFDKYQELQKDENDLSSPIQGYQVLRKVGQGAMGVVYKAIDIAKKQEVALKVLLPKFTKSKEDLGRFLRSSELSKDLKHPNLVETYEVGKCKEFYYQSMEFVRGEAVLDYMQRHGSIDEVICLTIVAEVVSSLAYLNSKGLVHRDIKPHNVMMTHTGEIKLADLGIIKDQENKHNITQEGISIGSPHYISPEQAMGEKIDIRSDLYSLGASMYHMLTGEYPYTGKVGTEILFKQVNAPPPNPLKKKPSLSSRTVRMVMKMMNKKPEERFQKPMEVIDAIRECILEAQ